MGGGYITNFEYNVLVNYKVDSFQLVLNFGCTLELLGGAFKNTDAESNPKDSNLIGLGCGL